MYNRKFVFAAASLGMLLYGVSVILLGSTLPDLVEQFEVSTMAAGSLAAILPFAILIGSLIFGPFTDRYGYKWLLVISCLVIFTGVECLAFSTTWFMIQCSVFLVGLGGGSLNGATNALVADISEGQRGAKLNQLGIFFGIGALGTPLILSVLSTIYTNQQIISTLGLSILIIISFLLYVQYPPPKHKQEIPFKEGLQMLKNEVMILLCLILFIQGGMEGFIGTWTTSYLTIANGLSISWAMSGLTIFLGALTSIRFLLSKILKPEYEMGILISGLSLALLGAISMFLWPTPYVSLIVLGLLGLSFGGVFPIIMGRIGDLWPRLSGTAFSVMFVFALLGNVISNYLMGIIGELWGMYLYPLFLVFSIILLIPVIYYYHRRSTKAG